jgi:hypothetical protein
METTGTVSPTPLSTPAGLNKPDYRPKIGIVFLLVLILSRLMEIIFSGNLGSFCVFLFNAEDTEILEGD